MPDIRYAVYYAPPAGSALARFGASWLGWDADAGEALPHSEGPIDVAAMTETPRKYGFHGTLKPPFRLRPGQGETALMAGITALASAFAPFEAPAPALKTIGSFIALVPSSHSKNLIELAAACVQRLDDFRAPLSEAEIAKRTASDLSPRQAELLAAWGYPYVLDEFRFHLTLTGPLSDADQVAAFACLTPLTAPFGTQPLPVREICLFQQIDGAPFRILHRYPLTG